MQGRVHESAIPQVISRTTSFAVRLLGARGAGCFLKAF